MENFNKRESIFRALRDSIELNSDLLEKIQEYIDIIKSDPKSDEARWIFFKGTDPDDCYFFIEPNIAGGDHLPKELGVSLTTAPDACMSKEQNEIFENCELYSVFECRGGYANIYINFSFDAETLCAAIQYLAQCYDCPIEEIKIGTNDYIDDDNDNKSANSSSNSGCAGMLALMLGVGGASVYGIVDLISRLIA